MSQKPERGLENSEEILDDFPHTHFIIINNIVT
ncbi:MAG: hypothetical protein ACJASP_001007 [Roseivirga sp.]|jgi:hypothetical protein